MAARLGTQPRGGKVGATHLCLLVPGLCASRAAQSMTVAIWKYLARAPPLRLVRPLHCSLSARPHSQTARYPPRMPRASLHPEALLRTVGALSQALRWLV